MTRRYFLGAGVIGVGGAVALPGGAGLYFWSDTKSLLTDPERAEFVYRDGWIVGVGR